MDAQRVIAIDERIVAKQGEQEPAHPSNRASRRAADKEQRRNAQRNAVTVLYGGQRGGGKTEQQRQAESQCDHAAVDGSVGDAVDEHAVERWLNEGGFEGMACNGNVKPTTLAIAELAGSDDSADLAISQAGADALAGQISYAAKQQAFAQMQAQERHQAKVDAAAKTPLGKAYLKLKAAKTPKQVRSARSAVRRATRNQLVKSMRANDTAFQQHPQIARAVADQIVRNTMRTDARSHQ